MRKAAIFDPANIAHRNTRNKISHTMKGKNKSLIWMLPALFVLALIAPAYAQDDLYYDPSTDTKPVPKYEETYDEPNNVTRRYDGDDEYYEEDDYAYEYSSRIRRFHRPAYGVDYYDPLFVDLYYYDPFFLPGASIYTYGYGDYWAWRRWQRWQRWNAWNPWNPWSGYGWGLGWNSWTGWNVGFGWGGWNAWNYPGVWNNYYYDPYWTWNGCNPYYGNVWVNNNYYYNNNNGGYNGHRPQTYTGPRRGGTVVNGGYARLNNGTGSNGRLVAIDKEAPVIELTRPNGRTNIEKAPTGKPVERSTPSDSRKPTGVSKDPNTIEGRNPAGRDVEKSRPGRETAPNNDVTPSRRPSRDTETRPSRQEETRPSRDIETRPSRQPSQETRPSRQEETRPSRNIERPSRSERGNNEAARPSRPSSEDRPTRNIESRPSRSNDSGGRSWDSGSPSRSSGSSGSSGSSRSGGSSGGGSKNSGGGSRGRN